MRSLRAHGPLSPPPLPRGSFIHGDRDPNSHTMSVGSHQRVCIVSGRLFQEPAS